MKQMTRARKRNEARKRKAVLLLEIDYELALLHEAMTEGNVKKVQGSKEKLEEFRRELLQYQN